WRWIDGSLDTYRKWAFREPNNVSQKDYCVVLYASFGHLDWSDISCSRNFPFLCKWKPA
ncbi:C-type lectin lectoxin-Lio2-like, partial [Pseudonaja textilis]|uniref:C-type lectin lectoxin-Lio2-like n=1 Tax=Pseudonaja textilis TaxID=8673 RepID=UPI000EA88F02